VGDKHVTFVQLKFIDFPPKPIQNNPVMKLKPKFSYMLLAALAAVSPAFAVDATTTPVGYYNHAGVSGGNVMIPGLVKPAAFAGTLTGKSATTLTLPASSLTASAFDKGAVYAAYYVEIASGPQAGVVLDIVSNTTSVITLADNITDLGLTGTESIKIRPHVTVKSLFSASESVLSPYSDNVTFYAPDGSSTNYLFGADGGTGWSSDFATADGDLRPIPPGTGVILGLGADVSLPISGEVKGTPTVAMLAVGVVNIVGPVNPLVGTTTSLNATGFGDLAAYADGITVYAPGPLTASASTSYVPLGDGTISSDFATATTDTIANTTGAVVIPSSPTALKLLPGFTVAP